MMIVEQVLSKVEYTAASSGTIYIEAGALAQADGTYQIDVASASQAGTINLMVLETTRA